MLERRRSQVEDRTVWLSKSSWVGSTSLTCKQELREQRQSWAPAMGSDPGGSSVLHTSCERNNSKYCSNERAEGAGPRCPLQLHCSRELLLLLPGAVGIPLHRPPPEHRSQAQDKERFAPLLQEFVCFSCSAAVTHSTEGVSFTPLTTQPGWSCKGQYINMEGTRNGRTALPLFSKSWCAGSKESLRNSHCPSPLTAVSSSSARKDFTKSYGTGESSLASLE